jgi:pantetheine-phosphate adenylyltransferase
VTTAIYAGSFDPVTNGHLDIIGRAAHIFDELVVAVYDAPPKNVLFSTKKRVDLIERSLGELSNVRVVEYTGLTVEFSRQVGAKVMIRGLRASSDFDYEFQMALMNKQLAPDLETAFLTTSTDHQFLSSSLIKEVAHLGGDVRSFVPAHVADALYGDQRKA